MVVVVPVLVVAILQVTVVLQKKGGLGGGRGRENTYIKISSQQLLTVVVAYTKFDYDDFDYFVFCCCFGSVHHPLKSFTVYVWYNIRFVSI